MVHERFVLELVEGGSLGEHELLRVRGWLVRCQNTRSKMTPFVDGVLVECVESVWPVGEDEGALCLADEA